MSKRRQLDRFDLEAEREGNALRGSMRSVAFLSKRVAKNRKTQAGLSRAIDSKIAKRYMIGT